MFSLPLLIVCPLGGAQLHNRAYPGRSFFRAVFFAPYVFLLPFGVLFLGFVLIPAVFGLWVSLHDYNYLLPGKPWVGLQNYVDLFTPDSRDSGDYWKSMLATGIFTVASVPFLIICPLGVALLLNRAFRGRGFFRAVFFAPYVLGVAVVGLLFRFVLDPNIGVVNYYLGHAIRGPPRCRGRGCRWSA